MTIARGEPLLASDINDLTFFPKGTILMYDGTGWIDNVTLKGWYKCDGHNDTPNLQDCFIKGSGSAPAKGGSNALTSSLLPMHAHGLSNCSVVTGGDHSHELSDCSVTGGGHSHDFSTTFTDKELTGKSVTIGVGMVTGYNGYKTEGIVTSEDVDWPGATGSGEQR
jgi:hypothetical protein